MGSVNSVSSAPASSTASSTPAPSTGSETAGILAFGGGETAGTLASTSSSGSTLTLMA